MWKACGILAPIADFEGINLPFGKDEALDLSFRKWRGHEGGPKETSETIAVVQHWGGEGAEFLGGDDAGSFKKTPECTDFEKSFPEMVRDGGGKEYRIPFETFQEKRMRAFSLGCGNPTGAQKPQENTEKNSISGCSE
jgi:hypothetical protein